MRGTSLYLACILLATLGHAQTATETVLRTFRNYPHGASPYGTLARDTKGNLYGTSYFGGVTGQGAVFKLEASGHYPETVRRDCGYQYRVPGSWR